MATWRPPPIVRPISVGVVRRGDEFLLMAVRNDERAADTLKHEFSEELGLAITGPRLLSVLENLFTHHDTAGHEIVFVFEATLADGAAYRRDAFTFEDGGVRNDVRWVALARFQAGQELLFPAGLLELLEASGLAARPLHQGPP